VVWRSAIILSIKWVGQVLVGVLVLMFLVILALVFFGGGRDAVERQVRDAIAQEDQAICAGLDMALGTPRYDECAAALKKVRENEHERETADDGFI
jgi:hypothetical protein